MKINEIMKASDLSTSAKFRQWSMFNTRMRSNGIEKYDWWILYNS
jgi:hypothetical protein